MIYMLNELSLMKVESKLTAQTLLADFINAASYASAIGFNEVRMYEGLIQSFYQLPLSDQYNIDNWLNDDTINSDLKDKFRLVVGTFPLFKEEDTNAGEEFSRSVFTHHYKGSDRDSFGLGAAYLYDTLSVSLNTNACWNKVIIPLTHYVVRLDGTDNTDNVETRHFFNIESLKFHINWWEKLQVESLEKSAELWNKRVEFFPNLEFSPEVEKQLEKLGFSKFLYQVIDRLKSLNTYAQNWRLGDFDVIDVNKSTNLHISTETDATLRKYGTLRKFTIPKRGKEIFHLHIKTGDLRFHFFADRNNHKVYIGYIGKHLRTVTFK